MTPAASLSSAQLGAMIGAFRFSAATSLLVPEGPAADGDVVSKPIFEATDQFIERAMAPMMSSGTTSAVTPFGRAEVARRSSMTGPYVEATVRRENDDELRVLFRSSKGGETEVSLSCRTALFRVTQSAYLFRFGRGMQCKVETDVSWKSPDHDPVRVWQGMTSAEAWRGLADGPEWRMLGRAEVRELLTSMEQAVAMNSARRDAVGEGDSRVEYYREHSTGMLVREGGTVHVQGRAMPYPPSVTNLIVAAAHMRPDLFPLGG